MKNGNIKWIGAALGFTPQEMMVNRECCDLIVNSMKQLIVPHSLSALKRHIFYF
jgi:hypothetical protein